MQDRKKCSSCLSVRSLPSSIVGAPAKCRQSVFCPQSDVFIAPHDPDWILYLILIGYFCIYFPPAWSLYCPLRYWSDIVFDIDIDWICLDIFATSVMSLLPPTILIGFPSQSICKQSKLQQIAVAINLLLVHMTQRRVLSLMWFKGNFSFNIMYRFTSPNKPSFCQTL